MHEDLAAIADQIAALTEPWRGPLLQFHGPVLDEEVAWAEQELDLTFPPNYRAFVRYFGSGRIHHYRLLGIHSPDLWGDVVAVNHLALPRPPHGLLHVADTPSEHTFLLDTQRRDDAGECPVRVYGPGASGRIFAANFLAFLQRVCCGLNPPAAEARPAAATLT